MTARILLIDDEDVLREDVAALLRQEGFTCDTAPTGEEGLRVAEAEAPDVILCDLVMPGISGPEAIRRLVMLCPEAAVIVITAHATVETTVEAFREGAVDYLLKPIVPEELFGKVGRSMERRQLERELRYLRREISAAGPGDRIVGNSGSIVAVRDLIARVGPSSSSVLITGESGTGKELVARAIHSVSQRSQGPFIAVNCAALPRDLAESELFGHVRGAFTGAMRDKPGYFELAGGGTLFLDEICELSPEVQAKLLRAIDQQEIFRVGGTRQIRTNVRIVAATNRNVKNEIAENRFREDLYFRVSVIEIPLPPLRERREDIPMLVDHLLHRLAAELKRRISGVDHAALRLLMSATWRGNIRELANVLERAILLTDDEWIAVADLPAELAGAVEAGEPGDDLRIAVRAYEREHIRQVLTRTDGNREEASRRLGIDPSTLYRRMKELNL
jgi:DNA-binding NtrC family response regulator